MKKGPLEPEDLAKLVYVSDPQISPDGKRVAFIVSRSIIDRNIVESNIWIADLDGGEEYIAGGEDYFPRWSRDSSKLLFVSRRGFKEEEKGEALYIRGARGGEPRLAAKVKYGIGDPEWGPDGRSIFFMSGVPREGVDEEGDFYLAEDLPVWFDGRGFVDQYRSQVFRLDSESGLINPITEDTGNVVAFSISNRGDRIAYAVVEDWRRPLFANIYVAELNKPESKIRVLSDFNVSSIAWSPDDGQLLVHGSKLERGYASHLRLYVVDSDRENSKPLNLTEKLHLNTYPAISSDSYGIKRAVFKPVWSRSGYIYFVVNEGGAAGIYRIDPSTMKIEPVYTGKHVVYSFTVSRDEEVIALLKATAVAPPEVYVYNVEEGLEKKLTAFNEELLRHRYIVQPEHFKFRASDGVEVEGWYLRPGGDEGGGEMAHPVILFVHGGPKASYGYAFNFIHQMMAGKGYYVVYVNPRGSDGYSEEFADIRGHYGERDYQDLMEALDKFLEIEKKADPERMGITGISYGGFMTNWAITKTRRFKAAVSENGISYWVSDFYTSDIGYHFDVDQIGETPWSNLKGYEAQSPLTYVDNVETPILLIHSMEDYRCFIDQSVAFHVALRLRGKQSRLIVFSKGSHAHSILGKPRHRVKRLRLILDFFNKHLMTAGDTR